MYMCGFVGIDVCFLLVIGVGFEVLFDFEGCSFDIGSFVCMKGGIDCGVVLFVLVGVEFGIDVCVGLWFELKVSFYV